MSERFKIAAPSDRLIAQVEAALVPFFQEGPGDSTKDARLLAHEVLVGYAAGTPKELQLAAQIVAYSWASLACLRAAAVANKQSLEAMMTLHEEAIALDRACQKDTKALTQRQKERSRTPQALVPANVNWDEGVFQLAINRALDKLNKANTLYYANRPVEKAPKLALLAPEPMTPAVLSRRNTAERRKPAPN